MKSPIDIAALLSKDLADIIQNSFNSSGLGCNCQLRSIWETTFFRVVAPVIEQTQQDAIKSVKSI